MAETVVAHQIHPSEKKEGVSIINEPLEKTGLSDVEAIPIEACPKRTATRIRAETNIFSRALLEACEK